MACWPSFYLAIASVLSTWSLHTFVGSLVRNLGYLECFRQVPRRLCLAKREGNKGSHFTAWHEGMGRVLQAQGPV